MARNQAFKGSPGRGPDKGQKALKEQVLEWCCFWGEASVVWASVPRTRVAAPEAKVSVCKKYPARQKEGNHDMVYA